MQKRINTLLLLVVLFVTHGVKAQIVGTSIFLQGAYLEIGSQNNSSLGSSVMAPSGYHPHTSGVSVCGASSTVAHVYDWGHDGWTTGTPPYMGDYTIPGTPWEGWMMQANGSTSFAYSTSCSFTGSGGLTGSWTSYSNSGGIIKGNWSGSMLSGGLVIRQVYTVDTMGSALNINVKMYNTTSSTITGVYLMRSCDPDNSQSWSGSFSTLNEIIHQNDYYNRVMVKATATGSASATGTPAQPLALGTKDCRAKCLIYSSWPMSTAATLSSVYAGTSTNLGSSYYTLGSAVTSDIAIGLVYKIGDIPAGDSAIVSYAYIYNSNLGGIDDAFPEPQLTYAGRVTDSVDTITSCIAGSPTMNLDVLHGEDRNWEWSDWTWAPATGLSATTGAHVVMDFSALTSTTTYTITGTNDSSRMGSCKQKVFLLTVVPVTVTPPVTRDTTYCLGVTVGPLTATGTSLMWYTSATGGTGSTTAPTPSTATLGTTTYWVSQSISGCSSARVPLRVTVAPPPIISVGNNSPLCPGDNLILRVFDTSTAGGTVTYSWTGPGGYTSTLANPIRTGVAYADSGVYYLVLNRNGCATYPTPTVAVIHSTPPSPVFTNPTYCQYLPSVPLSAVGSNIRWYTSATGGVGSATAPTPSTNIAGTFTWYVTQTINNCTSLRYPVVVTVNPKPVTPTITNTPGGYCVGERFNPFTIVVGSNIKWYNSATGGFGSPIQPVVNTNIPGSYTFWASQTLLGCEGDRTPITITVYDSVVARFNSAVSLGCNGDTLTFTNNSYGAINYLWTFGDGGSSSDVNTSHIYGNQGVYTVRLYAHSLNCVDSTDRTFDLRHPDTSRFTLSPGLICQGDTVRFTNASIGAGPTYQWFFGDGQSSNTVNPRHIYKNVGRYKVTLIAGNFIPCYDTSYDYVQVDSLGPISASISDTLLCLGTYITMKGTFTNIGLTGYNWSFGNGDSVHNTNPVSYAFMKDGAYTVQLTAKYRVCPEQIVTKSLNIFKNVGIDLGPDTSICLGSQAIVLKDMINAGNPAAQWLWNTGDRGASITVASDGLYFATVRIGGCEASDSVHIKNDCYVIFPNGFSPNKDGVNDNFNPRDYFTKGCKTFKMQIYNRWGQTIFETDQTEGRGWDGNFNGVPQPSGVYIYSIEAMFVDGQTISKKGNVTLLR